MTSRQPNSPSRREVTDDSLRAERDKTDAEMGKRRLKIEECSDAVLEQARQRADNVLEDARVRADEALHREGGSQGQRQAVRRERGREDATLQQERGAADARLEDERRERMLALRRILRLERDETDEHLLTERSHSDTALAAKEDFMGIVSHDVRTLLGGIALSATQITGSDDEAGRRNLKAAEKIQRFTARINRLVGDLVDAAAIEAGRFPIAAEKQDAKVLVGESMEAFQPAASAKSLILDTASPDAMVAATFDHDRVFQVLANLLSNAIKFTSGGGKVTLGVDPLGSEVRFSVSDTGPGIAGAQLERIFEQFWQIEKGDRRGLGLGLFISKSIVEAHGGRIWAESEFGKGTTIFFTLPVDPIAKEAEAAPPAALAPAADER